MTCSYHESNAIPNYLPSVIRVLDLAPLRNCEQFGGLSSPGPKLVLMPMQMEITGRARQSGMSDFIFGGGVVVVVVVVRYTARRLDCDPSNSIGELIMVPSLSRVLLLQFGSELLELSSHCSVLSVKGSKINIVPPGPGLLCPIVATIQVHLIDFVDMNLGFESSDHTQDLLHWIHFWFKLPNSLVRRPNTVSHSG
jgi:hypothetical protein